MIRRLALLLLVIATPLSAQEAGWPTDGWPTSTMAEQGVDAAPIQALIEAAREGTYGYVDRLVIVKHGYVVADERFPQDYREISRGVVVDGLGCGWEACPPDMTSHDYNYLYPETHPFYGGRDVHSLQSSTKSVASTAVGIALTRGAIEGVDAPLLSFFQDYDIDGVDPRLHEATLADLLTMRSGIEWHEWDRPLDETNSTIQLEHSEDWIQFTLDQPMDAAPGEKFVYSSGGSHLMSGIVRAATGMFIDEYAEQNLFGPLGISEYHWKKSPRGYPDTEGGLFLEAKDLAKIGLLYMKGGVWDGQRILSEEWVRDATERHVEVQQNGFGYGYQWWRPDQGDITIWATLGFGDNYMFVIPELDMIAVVNAWNVFGRPHTNILLPLARALTGTAGDM